MSSNEQNNTLYPAPVPKTGQVTPYHGRDDGALQKGVAWPNPRFRDNNDGTVTDNLTGLIWLKDAGAFEKKTWANALSAANSLKNGEHGLSDGSEAGDWRLPNVRELCSLIDYEYNDPALSNAAGDKKWTAGDPFDTIQSSNYWSSTTRSCNAAYGWYVNLNDGYVSPSDKAGYYDYVWPVRGGQ